MDTLADTGLEMFIQHGIPWLAKKGVEQARYFGSEALRQPGVQKKITSKAKQLSHKGLDYAIDALSKDLYEKASDKLRPKNMKKGGRIDYSDWYPMEMYTDVTDPTNPLYQRGEGLPIPFPFVDFKKAWDVLSAPGLFKGPEVSAKEGRALIEEYKRQYKEYKDKGGSRSYNSWIKWKGYGKGLDLHKFIGKLPKPKKGWVPPGMKYCGPYNPLEKQLRHDEDGNIIEIYEQPTGKSDAVCMQHDVDYTVCGKKGGDQTKCKGEADRKMVKSLDAIPWRERNWGHMAARNVINAKQKLGMGVKKPKNVKSRRVKKTGKKN